VVDASGALPSNGSAEHVGTEPLLEELPEELDVLVLADVEELVLADVEELPPADVEELDTVVDEFDEQRLRNSPRDAAEASTA
jgi:hypothetical protein